MLADPSPVASSVSAGHDRRSRCRELGESTGDRSRLRYSGSPPLRGRDSCEGRSCVCSQSEESHDRSRDSCSRSTARLRSRGRRCSRHDSSRFPSARVWSQRSRSWSSDRYRSRRVRLHSWSDCPWSRRLNSRSSGHCKARHDWSRSHGSSPFLLTDRSLGKGGGGLGGVARSALRQLLHSGIAATLGRGWSLPLRLQVALFLGSRPPCQTLPGYYLACQVPWRSGMQPWGLCFSAAGVTSTGVLPGPASPVTSAAPVSCSSASVPAPGVVTPAGAASATGSPNRH